MKDYIKNVFDRMDLKQIRAFMLMGSAEEVINPGDNYNLRLQQASDTIYKRVECCYTDSRELNDITNEVADALSAYEDVYMEIGMKAGARLLYQLLLVDNPIDGRQL